MSETVPVIRLLLAKLFGSFCVMLPYNYINSVRVSSGHSTLPWVYFSQHLNQILSPKRLWCTSWVCFRSVSLAESRIPCFIKFSKSPRLWSGTAATAHHTATTVWRLPLFFNELLCFTPDAMARPPSETLILSLQQMPDDPAFSFVSALVFILEVCHGHHFCTVSLSFLNHVP